MSDRHCTNTSSTNDLLRLVRSDIQTFPKGANDGFLFTRKRERHLVQLITLGLDATQDPEVLEFRNSSQMSSHLTDVTAGRVQDDACLEIYLLHQQDTWSPLNASRDMVSLLANYYQLHDGFFEIISGFKDRILPTEESFTGPSRSVVTENQREFGWVYKYSESKRIESGNPWCIRHTGLYHVFNMKHKRTTVFVLSPSPTARFISHIKRTIQNARARSTILANPTVVHFMLISFHLPAWRGYLEYHETELLKLDLTSACSSLEQPRVTFDTLKEVRAIEKRILPLDPLLISLNETMDHLQNIGSIFIAGSSPDGKTLDTGRKILRDLRKETGSYRVQALYLQKRAQSTAQSILDSLNLGFQQLAQTQNMNTFFMARSAREDSIAIRAITLVTSLYLPFSFVASIFGMNLVNFDTDSHNLVVSKQFWLFFVISVPLTAATLACWQCWMYSYRHSHLTEERSRFGSLERTKGSEEFEMV